MAPSDTPSGHRLPWGWLTALALALAAILGGEWWKDQVERPELVPSASILAILAGVLARNAMRLPPAARRGTKAMLRTVIPASIVLLGAGLDLRRLLDPELGLGGLAVTLASMCVALGAALLFARLAGLSGRTSGLLAAGTAVCGSSAILAVAPVLQAEEDELVVALGTVNLMGLFAMLAVPVLASAAGLSPESAGLFAGTTVHAVPQAVAAGAAVGEDSAAFATLFKMVRVAMLAPLVLGFGLVVGRLRPRSEAREKSRRVGSAVPWFVWGFLVLAGLRSAGALGADIGGEPLGDGLAGWGKHLLTWAMVAIGLEIDLPRLLGVGLRGLVAGSLASAALLAFGLACAAAL